MKYYTRHSGNLCDTEAAPVWQDTYDIILAGAGSGGINAALSAAPEGKRVLLLEKSRWCGGQQVQGLVNGFYYGI